MNRGLFITLEGADGCGKTTQAHALKRELEAQGKTVVLTREPGGTHLGEAIRDMLLSFKHTNMAARTEMLLYAASRAQHVEEVIRPHLASGAYVICDRFIDSSLVYQGLGLGLGVDDVYTVNLLATGGVLPDLTVVLELSAESAARRLRAKLESAKEQPDRIESRGLEYHRKVACGYGQLRNMFPDRVVVFDAECTPEAITRDIIDIIHHLERGGRA